MYYDEQNEYDDPNDLPESNSIPGLGQHEIFDIEIGNSIQSQIEIKDEILEFYIYISDYVNSTGFVIGRNLQYNDLISYYKESFNI